MISRSRSAPTFAAMSIECTTSANRTVTCLYSARASWSTTAAPHPPQNGRPCRGSMPPLRQANAAVIRSSAGPLLPRFTSIGRSPAKRSDSEAILECVQVFAGLQVSHWNFPRNIASVALMTEIGCENGLAATDVLRGSGLSETDLRDPDRMIVGRQELAIVTN